MRARYVLYACERQVQVFGGGLPEPRPGRQRVEPSELHDRGAPALCWGAAEPQLNCSADTADTILQPRGRFVHSPFTVFSKFGEREGFR